jgi:hypothetical protein
MAPFHSFRATSLAKKCWVSTGSDALVVGTDEMPPGNRIPVHKHLYEDEVIFVHEVGRIQYMPAESNNGVFGRNSNWRGPDAQSTAAAKCSRKIHAGATSFFSMNSSTVTMARV